MTPTTLGGDVPSIVTRDETLPAQAVRNPAAARRRWMAVGAVVVLAYAAAVLVLAATDAHLGFYSHNGSPLLEVEAGSAAAEAGLRRGDIIVAVNGVVTANTFAVHDALRAIEPDTLASITVDRGGRAVTATFEVGRRMPAASLAGIVLATILLALAMLADRGGPGVLPRTFFRSTLVYVVFLAGAFAWETVLANPLLAVPWFYSMVLAAPVTCHFMHKFPAGAIHQTRKQHLLLYAPPLAIGTLLSLSLLAFHVGIAIPYADAFDLVFGSTCGAMAAVYLTYGAVMRSRRLREKHDEVDPMAARWLQIGHFFVAVPLVLGTLWGLIDIRAFIGGGFKPFVAVAMVGGSICVVLALSRTPIGELDRMWRRSSGHFVATAMAAGIFLGFIGLAGGTASVLSGGDFQAALAATLIAAVLFGPVRGRLQQMIDERFARDRSKVRQLLRDAAEAAAATLDVDVLQQGVTHRVQAALAAEGAAIYVAEDAPGTKQTQWRRVALTGSVAIGAVLDDDDPIARRLNRSLAAKSPRELCAGIIGVPLSTQRVPSALIVAPRDSREGLSDEDRELMSTVAAQLVVALDNARAHTELREVNDKLRREYELAEKRRRQIARLKERVEEENRALLGQLAARDGRQPVIGKGLEATFSLVQKVARSQSTALVRGETGVGKELVARAIHAGSSRRGEPFIVVDCGAISKGVFESALFGHERGSFTGAIKSALGAFRSANGGTIFLDEIGELPLELQPKLLRVLQEREVHPLGADAPVSVDVRVVAGTNRDLAAEVKAGNFREDLLFRLQVIEIYVPPLRERKEDIPALADEFLTAIAARTQRPKKQLADDALGALLDHDWPGNVRELEHTLEAAVVYSEGGVIGASDLPVFEQVFRKRGERAISEHGNGATANGSGLRETLEDLERNRVIAALKENHGNRTRTAKALGMSRGALLRRLKRYDIQDVA